VAERGKSPNLLIVGVGKRNPQQPPCSTDALNNATGGGSNGRFGHGDGVDKEFSAQE
jgi:hypothetical protein